MIKVNENDISYSQDSLCFFPSTDYIDCRYFHEFKIILLFLFQLSILKNNANVEQLMRELSDSLERENDIQVRHNEGG